MNGERSQAWLEAALVETWRSYFDDVPAVNRVDITYFRPCKRRLGWIALSESGQSTLIGINRLLRLAEVPDGVCIITIAHELAHYCHGFGSPLARRYEDAHANGVVERELTARGLGETLVSYERWAEHQWLPLYDRYVCSRRRLSGTPRAAEISALPSTPVAAMDLDASIGS